MTSFAWRDRAKIGGDANAVGRYVVQLEHRLGIVTAGALVDSARDAASPIHRYFEWDDTVAAEAYRYEQARDLLRAVVMTSPANPDESVRAFLMVSGEDEDGYVSTVRAMSDSEMRGQVLARALAELRSFRKKYADLKELGAVLAAIEEVA